MDGHGRIDELLEEALASGRTPEEVCADDPASLPEVRRRWERFKRMEAQVEALFPSSGDGRREGTAPALSAVTPEVPGYRIEGVLGHGGMGIVYRARHLALNRPVALKMVLAGGFAGPAERQRLLREAQAVAGLCHPNIVMVHEVGEFDGHPYFTMELVGGGNLAERLDGTPQPAEQAVALLATLADATHAAHLAGIVHRDLKPANVLLTSGGAPKITDFGLARHAAGEASLTLTGVRIGTPSYMSPEQARGDIGAAGPTVDIYALGALLYELLTGRPPFRAETALETQRQVIAEEPAPPSRLNAKVPRDLETICLKCLRKDPAQRYATAADLAEDLQRFRRGAPIVARPIGALERSRRWVRRKPATTALLVALLALAGLAAAFGAREFALAAQRRSERAKWPERLAFVHERQQAGRFDEARAILARLPDAGDPELRRALERAKADVDLVERLDRIRLSRGAFTQGGGIDYEQPSRQYAALFRAARLGDFDEHPERVANRLRASPVRTALVAALDDWAACALAEPRAWVLAVARGADPDPWRDRARSQDDWANLDLLAELAASAEVDRQPVNLMVALGTRWRRLGGDPAAFLLRVQRCYPGDFWVNFELGHLLARDNPEAATGFLRAALATRPDASAAHYNLGVCAARLGRQDEALHHFVRVLESDPDHTWARGNLGGLLLDAGRPEDALAQFERALTADADSAAAQIGLRRALLQTGRGVEALAAWERLLATDGTKLERWDGYAELCLFLGYEAKYQAACEQLLARFGDADDPHDCERIGRACLLRPPSPERLRVARVLVERALAADPARSADWARPYFLLARALAEYRSGRSAAALVILEGEVTTVLRPAPQLLVAMALYETGQTRAAQHALAEAVGSFDWDPRNADNREAWIYHLLRREAEVLIGAAREADATPGS